MTGTSPPRIEAMPVWRDTRDGGENFEERVMPMNDLQAFKEINAMPGGRRVIQFHREFMDMYLMCYRDGRRVEVHRDAVTELVWIVKDGIRTGDPRWN